jgi:hypothetical protein
MVTVLRPLSTSELLDRTFHLYRNNFLMFVGIVAIPQLAVLALQIGGAALVRQGHSVFFALIAFVAAIGSYVAIEISQAATVMAVSNLHLDNPVSIGSAFSMSRGSMMRVIGITFAVAIAIGVAMIFLIIPGIYVALMWSLAIPVTVLEGGGLGVSTTRSKDLTKGNRGRIFVIYLLVGILTLVVSVVIQFPLQLVARTLAHGNPLGLVALTQGMQATGNFISTSLAGSLATIALTLVYYDLRVRKEGFDLQLMMARLQPNSQAVAATATSNI